RAEAPVRPCGARTGRASPAARLSGRLVTVLILQPLDRDDAFARRHPEYAHSLRRSSGDADLIDGAAYQLAGDRHNHDFVAVGDGERRLEPSILGKTMGNQALAAQAGAPLVKGGSALAHAVLREREDELFGRLQGGD